MRRLPVVAFSIFVSAERNFSTVQPLILYQCLFFVLFCFLFFDGTYVSIALQKMVMR